MSRPSRRLNQIEAQLSGAIPANGEDAHDDMTTPDPPPRPPFSSLPLDKTGPGRNCWGLFGPDDELGQLNYITPAVTKEAGKEIVHGIRIPLDLPIDFFKPPSFSRQEPEHKIVALGPTGSVHDDTIHINTQSSTQWDGFKHFSYQATARFYNNTTPEQVMNTTRIGTQAWVKAGGFATRGILLDFRRWAKSQNLNKPPFESTAITLADLKAIMAQQNITIRPGDVVMTRTGYLADYPTLDEATRTSRHGRRDPPTIGLAQSEDLIKWVWESGIVAMAGDSPSLECWPWPQKGPNRENVLHENFLAGWGLPIGEYFDLERLSEECEKAGKWSFFFTSMPIHVPGGVASPPNGIAIL